MEKECISDYNNMYTDYNDKISYYGLDKTDNDTISNYKNSFIKLTKNPEYISGYRYSNSCGFKDIIEYLNLMSSMVVDYGFNPYNKGYVPKLKLSTLSYKERRDIHDQL